MIKKQERKSSSLMPTFCVIFFVFLVTMTSLVESVDHSKFKTCGDSNFCKRNRINHENNKEGFYRLTSIQLSDDKHSILGDIVQNNNEAQPLSLKIQVYKDRMVRVTVVEKNPLANKKRYHVQDVLLPTISTLPLEWVEKPNDKQFSFTYESSQADSQTKKNNRVQVQINPFVLDLYVNGELSISTNDKGLFTFEHMREKIAQIDKPAPEEIKQQEQVDLNKEEGEQQDQQQEEKPTTNEVAGLWEENFSGHQDSKPHGPMAIGLDFTFAGSQTIYGIPEHSTSLALKTTKGEGINEQPYRLYNLDVFEYEIDKTMALYGAVPLIISHDTSKTVALFWLNAAETFVDIEDVVDKQNRKSKNTHWISETGAMDFFLLAGPTPTDIFKQYATLTGTTALPQLFSLGYHQCRWNYKSEDDVKDVDEKFDENNIPYDVIWLDIEHTDGKRYFTWDKNNFPTPADMQNIIGAKQRKMVTIVDPHIKRDNNYYIHSEATSKGYYVKNKDNNDYEGWCWPGSSSYLDFTSKEVRSWWSSNFAYDRYKDSTPNLYIWNDMNEPSVFNGPEVSMHKDAKHHGDVEHRDIHNLYGFYYHMATADGLVQRNKEQNDRSFVLSRAFFAGSQRIGAIWTGDNAAQWSHLEISNPMLLSLNLAGITFSGADVGGFFGNPEPELLARWYQAGAFQPFFRGHAHIDSRRREPWLFGEPYTSVIREAIVKRYSYLPLWYTTFYQNTLTGAPVMRPLWVEFPKEEALFKIDDQFMVGDSLLVKPVTKQGQTTTSVILPGKDTKQVWYDVDTGKQYPASTIEVETPLEKIPVYQRGGSVIPKKERIRRSSSQMKHDPYTIQIALSTDQSAYGELFVDDEHSFAYQKGDFIYKSFTFKDNVLTYKDVNKSSSFKSNNKIEKIVIYGLKSVPKTIVAASGDRKLEFEYDKEHSRLIIRKPELSIDNNWTLSFK
ncbi:hypothetical protein CYY_009321 [Polysphondylium violaceum]|uniref:Glucosidase II subunit alpha n=1 Tax=Polysphondylium violaceum TaxID=133409 RepID=A0A8J4V332_9MYCE|nr:hypothetical protein CYY_009321 [Polysphondylium violaceum]